MTQTPRDWQKDIEMCEAATPGLWMADELSRTWYGDRVGYFVMGEHFTDNNDGGIYGGGTFLRFEDAKFAAKAHAALPYWLQEAKTLQEIASGRGRECLNIQKLLKTVEDREQRLKDAVQTAISEKPLWINAEGALNTTIGFLTEIFSTLYPDTPAPKEGE